jgi:hypothetical protein
VVIVESHTHGFIAGQLRQALEAHREAGRILMTKVLPPFEPPIDEETILEQALEVARTSGAHLVLFVAGATREDRGVHGAEPGQTHIVLITHTEQVGRSFRFGGPLAHTQQWITYRALDMLRRGLLGLPLSAY